MIDIRVEMPQATPKKVVVSFEDEEQNLKNEKRERLRTWKNCTVNQVVSDLRHKEEEDTPCPLTFLLFIPPGTTDYAVTNIPDRS